MSAHSASRSLSKSPRRVARVALAVARTALPQYFHCFSRHDFEQAQLFAVLVLRLFFKTDYRGMCQILQDFPELQRELKLRRVPHYATLCRAAQRLAATFDKLLDQILVQAQIGGLISSPIRLALDSTGLEERHASRHYQSHCRKGPFRQKYWTKLGAACHTSSHLIVAARVARGPGNDCCLWTPLLRASTRYLPIDTALADAAFDSEENHVCARQRCGVRLSVIPLNPRTHGRKWPQTPYRRQMRRRFLKNVYAQRNHAESVFSQHKRILGTSLRARRPVTRRAETLLRVLVHDIMILKCFGRALQQSPLVGEGNCNCADAPIAVPPSTSV